MPAFAPSKNVAFNSNSSNIEQNRPIKNKEGLSHFARPALQQTLYHPVIEEIESLAELKENWDGEDALPISKNAISMAKELIRKSLLFKSLPNIRWQAPEFSPTADGGVDLEWDVAGRYLLLFISSNGTVNFLNKVNRSKLGKGKISAQYSFLLIYWVLSGI